MALNHYLSHLGNPQVEFAVKQCLPRSVIEAISFTIELESYMYLLRPGQVPYVEPSESMLPSSSSHGVAICFSYPGAGVVYCSCAGTTECSDGDAGKDDKTVGKTRRASNIKSDHRR